jgi:hypothetical protein
LHLEGRKGVNMFAELLLIGKLLDPLSKRSTPKATSPKSVFGRRKRRTSFTPIKLGKPKTIGEVMADLPPQRIEDITIPERYYRRPKGLD